MTTETESRAEAIAYAQAKLANGQRYPKHLTPQQGRVPVHTALGFQRFANPGDNASSIAGQVLRKRKGFRRSAFLRTLRGETIWFAHYVECPKRKGKRRG